MHTFGRLSLDIRSLQDEPKTSTKLIMPKYSRQLSSLILACLLKILTFYEKSIDFLPSKIQALREH